MGEIRRSRTKGISSPISRGFRGPATHLAGEGGDPPPPYCSDARSLFLLFFCGAAAQTVIIFPLLIPPPLLPLSDGASVVSSIEWGGPPLGIDARRRRRRRSQRVRSCPQPEYGGHVGGRFFCEILCVSHLPRVSCRYLILGQFQALTATFDAAPIPLLRPILSHLPSFPLLLRASPLLPPPESISNPASK